MAPMIRVTDRIALDERELDESFIRAGGPGGQNVNKVSSAVQLRFDVRRSPSLDSGTKQRMAALAGSRMTKAGVLVITAARHREQERNRAEALARLVDLIARAAVAPKKRRKTRPTKAGKERRLAAKARHSRLKRLRGAAPEA
jgi:ribosome-associated protein